MISENHFETAPFPRICSVVPCLVIKSGCLPFTPQGTVLTRPVDLGYRLSCLTSSSPATHWAAAPKGFSRGEAVSLWLTDEERRNVATGRHLRESGRGFPRLRNCIPTWKLWPSLICPSVRTGAPSPRGKAWALPRRCNVCNQFITEINTPGQDRSLQDIWSHYREISLGSRNRIGDGEQRPPYTA